MSLDKSAALPSTAAPAYTDLAGLSSLKRGAATHDPNAIRRVAQEFESMFTRMMLKSMRDAVGPDPMFGSDQEQMYQGMADDQLSIQLSRGKGLGLADMLIRQLQKMGVAGAAAAGQGTTPTNTRAGAAAYNAVQRTASTTPPVASPATSAQQANFVRDLWPHAQQAGEQLGVDPRNLIAQAALETNWGRNVPQGASGASSNNLFGVKAAGWKGDTVTAPTQEFQGGTPTSTTAQFRAYASQAESFQDYVALLRDNPRYASALNTGGNTRAFAAGLQNGGYATDPDYARKISAIAASVSGTRDTGSRVSRLKSADATPITGNTGTL